MKKYHLDVTGPLTYKLKRIVAAYIIKTVNVIAWKMVQTHELYP